MSELSHVEQGALFSPEDWDIIKLQRVKAELNDPKLEISDSRLLEMHKIVQKAAEIGSKATIESSY